MLHSYLFIYYARLQPDATYSRSVSTIPTESTAVMVRLSTRELDILPGIKNDEILRYSGSRAIPRIRPNNDCFVLFLFSFVVNLSVFNIIY